MPNKCSSRRNRLLFVMSIYEPGIVKENEIQMKILDVGNSYNVHTLRRNPKEKMNLMNPSGTTVIGLSEGQKRK